MRPLNEKAKGEVLATLRKGVLPKPAQRAFIRAIKRHPTFERLQAAKFLLGISALDGQASYTQENCGSLIVRLLSEVDGKGLEIQGIAFAPDSLRDRKLGNLTFRHSFFAPTSLELSTLNKCTFEGCHFGQLRIYGSTAFQEVQFEGTTVDSVRLVEQDSEVWDPLAVRATLEKWGVRFSGDAEGAAPESEQVRRIDQELRDFEKLIRYFMRSTHISENVILMKLGNRGQCFLDDSLPQLVDHRIMIEIDNRGGGVQRRFKLGQTLEAIDQAMTGAQGSFSEFLKAF
jgi:hypothetical protein